MSMSHIIGIPIRQVNRYSDSHIGNNTGMSIGKRVRKARKAKGLSQAQLAAKVGISQSTLSELEGGDSASTGYTASLAAALGVSALWLESGRGPERPLPTSDASELDRVIELLALYKASSSVGRATIFDAARFADKSGEPGETEN